MAAGITIVIMIPKQIEAFSPEALCNHSFGNLFGLILQPAEG